MTYEELNTRINKIDYDFKVLRGSLWPYKIKRRNFKL